MKRRAGKAKDIEEPGQDSFLDVVANLVGVMIILVMVVGAQAQKGFIAQERAKQTTAPEPVPIVDVAGAEAAAASVEASISELDGRIKDASIEAARREAERNRVQLLVTIAEQRLAEHRTALDEQARESYDLVEQLNQAKAEMARLDASQTALTKPSPAVLEHLPTPMAKTVFGREIHFRLLGGKVAYVPWDEMLERLKADAPGHVGKLRDSARAEMSLPVINGFGARYILRRAEVETQTRLGVATQSRVELEKLYFVDAEPNLGVPLAKALETGSEFRSRIGAMPPQQTTVTIWVYPDSFDEFRALKAELFKLGYLTAGRPLPAGHPIGGSPDGSRSSAE
jgi:hypothetical protein